MLFQLGFKALKQRESVCGCARKTRQHLAVVELAHLARRALDDDVTQCDLTITTDSDLYALGSLAAHANDGGAVKLFHLLQMGQATATSRAKIN